MNRLAEAPAATQPVIAETSPSPLPISVAAVENGTEFSGGARVGEAATDPAGTITSFHDSETGLHGYFHTGGSQFSEGQRRRIVADVLAEVRKGLKDGEAVEAIRSAMDRLQRRLGGDRTISRQDMNAFMMLTGSQDGRQALAYATLGNDIELLKLRFGGQAEQLVASRTTGKFLDNPTMHADAADIEPGDRFVVMAAGALMHEQRERGARTEEVLAALRDKVPEVILADAPSLTDRAFEALQEVDADNCARKLRDLTPPRGRHRADGSSEAKIVEVIDIFKKQSAVPEPAIERVPKRRRIREFLGRIARRAPGGSDSTTADKGMENPGGRRRGELYCRIAAPILSVMSIYTPWVLARGRSRGGKRKSRPQTYGYEARRTDGLAQDGTGVPDPPTETTGSRSNVVSVLPAGYPGQTRPYPETIRRGGMVITSEEEFQRRGRRNRLIGWAGGLAAGVVAAVLAWEFGVEPALLNEHAANLPSWWDPSLYPQIKSYDPSTIAAIMANHGELYRQLQNAGTDHQTIADIYQHMNLYHQLQADGISQDQLLSAFSRPNVVDKLALLPAGDRTEVQAVFNHLDVFGQLVDKGLEPQAAAQFVRYPDLIDAWNSSGRNSDVVAAVFSHQDLFEGLGDAGVPYDDLRNALLHPDSVNSALSAVGQGGSTGAGSGPIAPAVSPAELNIYVEPGHGFTQEILDELNGWHAGRSGDWITAIHEQLMGHYGNGYIAGIPKYQLPSSVWGHWGFARPGSAHWEPGALETLKYAVETGWQPGQPVTFF